MSIKMYGYIQRIDIGISLFAILLLVSITGAVPFSGGTWQEQGMYNDGRNSFQTILFSGTPSVEIRGSVANATALDASSKGTSWNYANFAGFWYDLKDNQSTESLAIQAFNGPRSISKEYLWYNTTIAATKYKVASEKDRNVEYGLDSNGANPTSTGAQYYDVVGWMAEKYIGINGKTNKLAKLILEQDTADKKTLIVGETWEMGGGYTLTVPSIDARSKPILAWFVLSKDGVKIDEKVLEAALSTGNGTQGVYTYFANLGGESNVPIFVTYVDSIDSVANSDMVQLKYTWLIDNTITEIKSGDKYGIFKVDSETPLRLKSNSSVSLFKDSTVTLAGNMKFRVSDSGDSDVRFYPMIVRDTPGTWEVRGSVANATALDASSKGTSWNYANFAGFWYDLKTNQSTESLAIQAFNGPRSISKEYLWYNTTIAATKYKVASEKDRNVEYGLDSNGANPLSTGDQYYDVVGWMAEKYIGINGKTNKLAKLILEQDTSDKKTLTVGETWEMGGGYTLTAQSIDARSRLARFILSKDGVKIDEKVLEAALSTGNGTQGVYTYFANLGGESNVPIFVTYVDSIDSIANSDMVHLKYTWLIDNTIAEIKSGDLIGIFKVDSETPLRLKSNSSVSLSRNSTVTLAGNMKFRVADSPDGDVRFYPKVDYVIMNYSTSPSILVKTPNKGENWLRGTTKKIKWSSIGDPGANVKIELLKGGLVNEVIASSTPNNGSFNWAISATQTLGSDYKINIESTTNSSYKDVSNKNFIISTINCG